MNTAASAASSPNRRLPIGAEPQPAGGVHFRVWAPRTQRACVVVGASEKLADSQRFELTADGDGYWSGAVAAAGVGAFYKFHIDSGEFPDPASRFQPDGPHGASQVVDSTAFPWTDGQWTGVAREGQLVYEMHIGAFTRAGTWAAAVEHLPYLAELGITVLELMPVADFPGRFGWGYDGVAIFAPTRLYGLPDDFRRFVDRAHALGLGVILDVVYNHLGPDGNYLREYASSYFSTRYENEWGDPLNFDGEESAPVREFFLTNATYWIEEFHLDGLRLDATQQIFDSSSEHILAEMARATRRAAGGRAIYLVAENESQDAQLVRSPESGGMGLDAIWNDDFHHSAIVALTGRREAYYTDYHGSPQEFVSLAKWGFLYQGQIYSWQKKRRGTPSFHLTPAHFLTYLQNHDQIANSLQGRRIHDLTSDAKFRALTALLLLGPNTPMLFQGQEFTASAPFLYFADHNPELASAVAAGRAKFLQQFPSIASEETTLQLCRPDDESTFSRCKLDHAEREIHREAMLLHRELIRLRKENAMINTARRGTYDGAVLSGCAFVLRYFGQTQDDRLLVVNLGPLLHLNPAPEPLLAPPSGCHWNLAWSSEDPRYGGSGTPRVETEDNWHLPAESAVLLSPSPLP